jgi:REP element-mobilizing transposase RayT
MYEAEAYYFVTARCFQSRLLLRPTKQLTAALGGVLAKAAQLHDVDVCGFVAASNHVHLLCRVRDGALSDFMKYFLGNASKKVGRLVDWRGQLWERRFSAEKVLDDAALEGRLRYILSHGVKEGLVRKASEWPGLSCLEQLLGNPKRTFLFYEWSKRWEHGKLLEGADNPWAADWATPVELELKPLRHWQEWSPQRRQAQVRQMVRDIEAEWRSQHRSVVGAANVLAQHPHTRLAKTKRSTRPMLHTTDSDSRAEFDSQYADFVSAFRRASELFRSGNWKDALFPKFSFRPWVPILV